MLRGVLLPFHIFSVFELYVFIFAPFCSLNTISSVFSVHATLCLCLRDIQKHALQLEHFSAILKKSESTKLHHVCLIDGGWKMENMF
jgi:hypothetical protein